MLLFAIIGFSTAFAQKSKVTTGALNVDQGRYEDAVKALEEGLSKPELFKKDKDLAKGYYYLVKAYVALASDEELSPKYPEAPMKAYAAHEKLMAFNSDSDLWKNRSRLERLDENIWVQLYSKGVNFFNESADDDALAYFKGANSLNDTHFLTKRMLASAYLVKADTANSIEIFDQAIKIYVSKYIKADQEALAVSMQDEQFKQDVEQDKGQMSYVIRQLAVIHEAQGRTEEALAVLSEGSKILPDDEDVRRQELSVYQAHPDLYDRAVEKFEAQLATSPGDNAVRLAYASMLERAGKNDRALTLYQEAYDLDPTSLQANYGLAAIRINMAAELSEKRTNTNDDDEIESFNEQIKVLCTDAYPYLVWLTEAQPDEPEWVSQLVNVTPIIGKTEEMKVWAEKLGKMRRGEN